MFRIRNFLLGFIILLSFNLVSLEKNLIDIKDHIQNKVFQDIMIDEFFGKNKVCLFNFTLTFNLIIKIFFSRILI